MDSEHRTGRRGGVGWTLVVTSLAGFMAALDNLVVTTALPSIRADLGGALGDLEWTVSAYTLTFAVLLLFGAALGDRFGRRRFFVIGVGVFTAASAWAALASGMGMLIAARAAQGVGGAILMPLSLTLLSAATPAGRRGLVLGVWGAVHGLAVGIGPLVGGVLTEHLNWHWVFWLNVPVGLLLMPLARLRLAESRKPGAVIDVPGTLLASGGLFGLVYGIVRGTPDGWTSGRVLTGLIAGGALLVAFVAYETAWAPRPMLPMRLFRGRGFAAINLAGTLMFLGMFGSIFLLSQFLQGVVGYSPVEAGVRMLPWTAMPMVAAPVAGALADRYGGRPVVVTGLALQAAGLALFALVAAPGVSYAALVPALVASGLGMGMFFAPSASLVMASVRPDEQGIASGVNNALREVGGALGVAALSAVFSARGGYGSAQEFVDGLVPALWVGAAAVALAAVAALATARSRGAGPAAGAPAARGREAAPA